MNNLLARRDELLRRTARFSGLSFTALSFLCIIIPDAIPRSGYPVVIALFIVLTACQSLAGSRPSLNWQLGTVATGLALIVSIGRFSETIPTPAAIAAIESLGSAAIASVAIVMTASRQRLALLAPVFLLSLGITYSATSEWENPVKAAGLVILGWSLSAIVGLWTLASVPAAHRRITTIGAAHQAQHTASEIEAQRRHAARLLHDTVLSTLTLLAHSGVGVSAPALRQQAAEDAKLLRELRLGGSPRPVSSGGYHLERSAETELGTTLTAVKERFGRIGLEVSWHGAGELVLPAPNRDALLLALTECLENVRRHSGATEASVTIVADETSVKAMVTDAGVGFVVEQIDSTRLGFTESVVARLREVGGTARVFSALGAGTTVVLVVPR